MYNIVVWLVDHKLLSQSFNLYIIRDKRLSEFYYTFIGVNKEGRKSEFIFMMPVYWPWLLLD